MTEPSSASTGGKFGLVIAALIFIGVGIGMIYSGADDPTVKYLIGYGGAAILIGVLGLIYGLAGHFMFKASGGSGRETEYEVMGFMELPWWLWLIDLGIFGLGALIGHLI